MPSIQLELFGTTKKLNLSQTYVNIPKEVAKNDPDIEWVNENIALPIEKSFTVGKKTALCEIKPTTIKNKKTGISKTIFPHFRELRVENALVSLLSKKYEEVSYHGKGDNGFIYKIELSIYQIQKEITDAINIQEGRKLKPNECPYNSTSIRESLEILAETKYKVKDSSNDKESLNFSRINAFYANEKTGKLIIEVGSLIADYIVSGDWKVVDAVSVLASKGYYEMKLRMHLNLNFRYANERRYYHFTDSRFIEIISFKELKTKSKTISELKKIAENMNEIDRVVVEPKKDGRKTIGAVFKLYPAKDFVNTIFNNNKLLQRVETAVQDSSGELILKPIEADYNNITDYLADKRKYDIQIGKVKLQGRHKK